MLTCSFWIASISIIPSAVPIGKADKTSAIGARIKAAARSHRFNTLDIGV